jgi:hypothetical protein
MVWWDLRNLSEPVEKLLLDFTKTEEPSFSNAMGISCLEYEHSIPTKFMVHFIINFCTHVTIFVIHTELLGRYRVWLCFKW